MPFPACAGLNGSGTLSFHGLAHSDSRRGPCVAVWSFVLRKRSKKACRRGRRSCGSEDGDEVTGTHTRAHSRRCLVFHREIADSITVQVILDHLESVACRWELMVSTLQHLGAEGRDVPSPSLINHGSQVTPLNPHNLRDSTSHGPRG